MAADARAGYPLLDHELAAFAAELEPAPADADDDPDADPAADPAPDPDPAADPDPDPDPDPAPAADPAADPDPDPAPDPDAEPAPAPPPGFAYSVALLDAALARIDGAVDLADDDLALAELLATRDLALGR